MAIWTPVFTGFMHDYLSARQRIADKNKIGINQDQQNGLHVGDVIQAAMQIDMQIGMVLFKEGSCLDIGTPEDMMKAVKTQIW